MEVFVLLKHYYNDDEGYEVVGVYSKKEDANKAEVLEDAKSSEYMYWCQVVKKTLE